MAKYRSLLLGCGGRAHEHAAVYRELPDLELAACCDLVPERVATFQQRYGIPAGFHDYEDALRQVQPDIVHIVTSPGRRVWEAEVTAAAGVQAAIFEKPVAIKPSDLAGLRAVAAGSPMKILVNCQRRYFPQFRDGTIRDIVANELGQLTFVRASTCGNTMGMGPHTVDLLLLFLGEERPTHAWAMAHTIHEEGYEISHQGPRASWPSTGSRAAYGPSTTPRPTPWAPPARPASGCTCTSTSWAAKVGST